MADLGFHCLSDDLMLRILSYVNMGDMCNLSKVNTQFKRLVSDRSLVRSSDFEQSYFTTESMFTDYIKCNCNHVERLSLNHCYWLSGKVLESLLPKCKNLRQLFLLDISLTSKRICKIIGSLPHLESFAFTVANVDEFDNQLNASEQAQRCMCNLKYLTIHFKVGITPRTEQAISVQFIQKKTSFFEHCQALTGLHVIGHPNLGCGLPKLLVQPNVVKLENLKNLKELSLNYAIDPAARIFYYGTVLSVAKLQLKLKTMLNPSANFDSQIQTDFWKTFWSSQQDLENLDLSNISLKNVFPTVFNLAVTKVKLKYLNISDTDNREAGMSLAILGQVCPNLQSVNLRNSHLVYLTSHQQQERRPDPNQPSAIKCHNFDIDGFTTFINLCQKLVHVNISNVHIHQLSVSDRFCSALSTLTGLKSIAVSPCCLARSGPDNSREEKAKGVLHSGMKHAASTILVQCGKRRRVGIQAENTTAEPVPSTSAISDDSELDSGTGQSESSQRNIRAPGCRTGLLMLTDVCRNITHLELINAGLIRPIIHRGSNGLMPKPCLYVPCAESYCVTDKELMCLGQLKNLQYLQLAGLPGIITGSFLSVIARECPRLTGLHLAYLGLTAHCIYTNQLCQAFQFFTNLCDLRLEQAYLSIDATFCKAAQKCSSLQRLCVVSKNGSIDSAAVIEFMSELLRLTVLQLFTDATHSLCKKLQKSLRERFESTRPALSVTIWPLFHQDTAHVMNAIPTKHLEELTIFSSKICQQPPS